MSGAAGRLALAALRSASEGSVLGIRAANPRGALLPGRAGGEQGNGLRPSFQLSVVPAQLPPWLSLGGRARSASTRGGTYALARTVFGLGARICQGGVSRRLTGSRGGGRPPEIRQGQLMQEIKGCTDAGGLLLLLLLHGQSFDFIHIGAAWGSLAGMRGAGARGADGEVIQRLQALTRAKAPEMDVRGVSSVLYSMAKMYQRGRKVADDELEGELLARAVATAGDFDPQGVANLLWSLATMGSTPDPRLLEAMQGRATAMAGDFTPQGVANLMWALATMGSTPDPRLLEAMQGRATAMAGDFTPQGVANLLWSLATMGSTPDPRLLAAMQGRATATAGDFTPQGVTNLMWALATMGSKADPLLLAAMQRRATATTGDFNPQDFANLLWALACFDTSPSQVSGLMVESMAVRLLSVREQLSVEGKTQVHQWLLFCDLHPEWCGKLPRSMQLVKQELGAAFRQAFVNQPRSTSRLQV
ncbi:hypothetical protein T484DRAFT_2024586 [Baffinella frigidus]|nr:hypothetical protein T484DRAFT_2024586 [Cryptophyta sp. CCMP2293]